MLLLDEPTSMLTPQGVADLGRMLRRLKDKGVALILITHKLLEAFEFGDRISVLRQGHLAGEIDSERMSSLAESDENRRSAAPDVRRRCGRGGDARRSGPCGVDRPKGASREARRSPQAACAQRERARDRAPVGETALREVLVRSLAGRGARYCRSRRQRSKASRGGARGQRAVAAGTDLAGRHAMSRGDGCRSGAGSASAM